MVLKTFEMDEREGKPVVENVWPVPETQGSEHKRRQKRVP